MARLRLSSAVTLGVLLGVSPAAGQEILRLLEPDEKTTPLGTNEFPHAVWMGMIADGQGARILIGGKDPIFREGDPRPVKVIQGVGPESLGLTLTEGKAVRVVPGRPIPGARDLVFRQAVLVKILEYRQRVVHRTGRKLLGGDLYLVEVHGSRAILQRDIDPPPSSKEVIRNDSSIRTVRLTIERNEQPVTLTYRFR